MSNRPEIVVVGAGVIGAAIAYRLARAGARVTLVDRGEPGQGTSANSFAWVNSNDKPPLAYHRLNAESVVAHRRLREDVGSDLEKTSGPRTSEWLHEGGGLEWTDTEAGRQRLLEKAARLRAWGYRVEALDEAEVRALEPHLRLDGLTAATFCPDEAWVDGPRFAAALGAAAEALGATVRTGEAVVGLERNGERVSAVRLAGGERLRLTRTFRACR